MPGSSRWRRPAHWSLLGAKLIDARSFSPGKINNANDNFILVHLSLFRCLRINLKSLKWLDVLVQTARCAAETATLVHIISAAHVLLSSTPNSRRASTSIWLGDSCSQIALSGECCPILSLSTLRWLIQRPQSTFQKRTRWTTGKA